MPKTSSAEGERTYRWGRTKAGYWEVRWTERTENGRARTRSYSCGTKDRQEAEIVFEAWRGVETQIREGHVEKTIGDLIDVYERQHVELNGKSRSQKWALLQVRRKLGIQTLLSLNSHRLAWYVTERRGDGVKDPTIRRELGALRAVLAWCLRKGVLPAGTLLPHIDLPAASQARLSYLDETEEQRMWEAASKALVAGGPDRRIALFVCIALETAARSRAIETLEWSRVKLDRGFIDFRDPSVKESKKRRVAIPISDRLRPVLELAQKRATNGYVLENTGSTYKAFRVFCEAHGFAGVTRHDLRRTWATLRAQWGVSMFDIAGVLGDTVETVTKHYAHHSPEHLRGAINARPK